MVNDDNSPPGIAVLGRKLASTGLGLLQNRGELLAIEFQEERSRFITLISWSIGLGFLGMLGLLLLTGTIIFLFPEDARKFVAGAFALLYLAGAVAGIFIVRAFLKRPPFEETLNQFKKDRELLDTFK